MSSAAGGAQPNDEKPKVSYAYQPIGSPYSTPHHTKHFNLILILSTILFLSYSAHHLVFKQHDPYALTPFCNSDGNCGENPATPSPRTVYSAKSRVQYQLWWNAAERLKNSVVSDYVRDRTTKKPLVLLGDSITEFWSGREYGRNAARCDDVPPVFREVFGRKDEYDPLALGISGDQTQHLLWRLAVHGELDAVIAEDADAVFVVLIGTNNLGAGILPGPTATGVMKVIESLLDMSKGKVILMQILPRGDNERVQRLCPPRCDKDGNPFESFMPAVNKVNDAIKEGAGDVNERYDNRLTVLDCNRVFDPVEGQEGEVNVDLMPDRLHPNAEGYRALGMCIMDCIQGGVC